MKQEKKWKKRRLTQVILIQILLLVSSSFQSKNAYFKLQDIESSQSNREFVSCQWSNNAVCSIFKEIGMNPMLFEIVCAEVSGIPPSPTVRSLNSNSLPFIGFIGLSHSGDGSFLMLEGSSIGTELWLYRPNFATNKVDLYHLFLGPVNSVGLNNDFLAEIVEENLLTIGKVLLGLNGSQNKICRFGLNYADNTLHGICCFGLADNLGQSPSSGLIHSIDVSPIYQGRRLVAALQFLGGRKICYFDTRNQINGNFQDPLQAEICFSSLVVNLRKIKAQTFFPTSPSEAVKLFIVYNSMSQTKISTADYTNPSQAFQDFYEQLGDIPNFEPFVSPGYPFPMILMPSSTHSKFLKKQDPNPISETDQNSVYQTYQNPGVEICLKHGGEYFAEMVDGQKNIANDLEYFSTLSVYKRNPCPTANSQYYAYCDSNQEALLCKNNGILNLQANTCVGSCPPNTVHNPQEGTCDFLAGCEVILSTDPSKCETCLETFYLQPGSQLCEHFCEAGFHGLDHQCFNGASCPSTHYKDSQNICHECDPTCLTCNNSGPNQCTSCPPNFSFIGFSGIGECVQCGTGCSTCSSSSVCTVCLPGFYLNGEICEPCDNNCLTCETSATHCLSCDTGTNFDILHNDACLENCPNKYFLDITGQNCLPCDSTCLTCSEPGIDKCTSCEAHKAFQLGSCFDDCDTGFYENKVYDEANPSLIVERNCHQCNINCPTCTNEFYCTSCSASMLLAPKALFPGSQINCVAAGQCPSQTFGIGQECQYCDVSCIGCQTAANQCIACASGYEQDLSNPQHCIANCNSDEYYDTGESVCKPCDNSCLHCDGPSETDCTACVTTGVNKRLLYQYEGKCYLECPIKTFEQGNICEDCFTRCLTCSSSADNKCLSCPTEYKFLQEGTCMASCSSNYYESSGTTCTRCHDSCATCSGPSASNCDSCPSEEYLQGSECLTKCNSGFVSDTLNKCVPCDNSCATCNGTADTDCLTCQNTSLTPNNDGRCLEPCGEGQFMGETSCQECDDSCQECTGNANNQCTSCNNP